MPDGTDTLILRLLCRIDHNLDRISADVSDINLILSKLGFGQF